MRRFAQRWRRPSRASRCWCWSARRRTRRRQQPLHRRRDARRLQRRRRHQDAGARSHAGRDRQHRFRHLHRGPVLRRHGARHRIPHRSRPGRAAGHAAAATPCAGCARRACASPDLRPPGLQDRRQVQVLGRPHGRSRRRRARPGRHAHRVGEEARHRGSSTARARCRCSPTTTASRACASASTARRTRSAQAVVLACGGFEANAEWRTRYLGPGWDLAKVRGTRFNTGDGIRMALDIGASRTATGRAATRSAGTSTRRSSATSRSATSSRSTAIRSAS